MPHKLAYTRYKLVSHTYTTYNNTLWRDVAGKWLKVTAVGEGNVLCTSGVIHFYDHPVLAVLFNQVHANIDNPRLLKIRTSRPVAHDGLKGGCKYARAVGELPVPSLSLTQWIEFAIRVALCVYNEPSFREWAYGWLTKKDRSVTAAHAAYAAATANAAAYAAAAAAHAATTASSAAATAEAARTSAYYATIANPDAIRIFKSVLKTMNLYKLAGS